MGIVFVSIGVSLALLLLVLVRFLRQIMDEYRESSRLMRECTESINAQNRLILARLSKIEQTLGR